jgi:hypothetical protein
MKRDKGNILLGVMILVAISAIMIATALDFAATSSRTTANERSRTREYYESEQSLAIAVSWLRSNSKNLTTVFGRSNFYQTFDRSAPSYGGNDSGVAQVHTKVKLRNTNNSVFLANDSALGASSFPNTTNASTGASFNPVSEFSSGSFGPDLVRITLVDAVPVDPAKDFGDPDNGAAPPQTDFYPVFRIDAMESTSKGSHVYGYVVGNLIYDYGIGFYGRDFLELRQTCDSYLSTDGQYTDSTKWANCSTGSNGEIRIHQAEALYGSAQTNGSIRTSPPFGGNVCSDFLNGCPNRGLTCQGSTCNVPDLPVYGTWSSYCPTNQGNLNVNSDSTLTVAGNSANQKCWNNVSIGNGTTLTLTSTSYAYFFNSLNLNNGTLAFEPNPNTGTITLYVNNWGGNNFNGNQVLNTNNKPFQLRIHYLGNNSLTLNGTAEIRAFIVSPNAGVTVSGNFDYHGGIRAANLTLTGNGDIHYDESGDVTTLGDSQYSLRNIIQKYR